MKPLVVYTAKRILLLPVMLFLVASFAFLLIALNPVDPAVLILGEFASDERIALLHEQLGLNRPFLERYWDYVARVFRGDLGSSYLTGASVAGELMRRLPNSLVLIIPSLLLAMLLGTLVGTIAGRFRGKPLGSAMGALISSAQGVPPFFLAIVLIYLFVFQVRIFPAPTGMLYSTTKPPTEITGVILFDAVLTGNGAVLAAIGAHAILPVLSTAIFLAAYFAKTVRTGITQSLAGAQIEFARAMGLPAREVLRYALLSTRTSVLTYAAILFGVMLSATAVVEIVFSWPGAGAWALDGVLKSDLPVIQGFIVVTGAMVIVAYVALDVIVAALDPRIVY